MLEIKDSDEMPVCFSVIVSYCFPPSSASRYSSASSSSSTPLSWGWSVPLNYQSITSSSSRPGSPPYHNNHQMPLHIINTPAPNFPLCNLWNQHFHLSPIIKLGQSILFEAWSMKYVLYGIEECEICLLWGEIVFSRLGSERKYSFCILKV